MPRPNVLTDKQIAAAKRLYLAGCHSNVIADACGVSKETIHYHCNPVRRAMLGLRPLTEEGIAPANMRSDATTQPTEKHSRVKTAPTRANKTDRKATEFRRFTTPAGNVVDLAESTEPVTFLPMPRPEPRRGFFSRLFG